MFLPIDEDANVPPGAVLVAEVTVSQYLRPDGSLGLRTFYDGDLPLSSVLGLLAMGGIDIYGRCDRG
jgi:hypothetical protein